MHKILIKKIRQTNFITKIVARLGISIFFRRTRSLRTQNMVCFFLFYPPSKRIKDFFIIVSYFSLLNTAFFQRWVFSPLFFALPSCRHLSLWSRIKYLTRWFHLGRICRAGVYGGVIISFYHLGTRLTS